jgi:hypothetical protein
VTFFISFLKFSNEFSWIGLAFKFQQFMTECPSVGPGRIVFPLCRRSTFAVCFAFTPDDHTMLGPEDGIDAIAVVDVFHLVWCHLLDPGRFVNPGMIMTASLVAF